MKQFQRGQGLTLGLALIAAGLAAQPVLAASAAPAPKSDPSVVAQLRDAASGTVALRANPATGKVGFARAKGAHPDLLAGMAAEGRQGAIAKATTYLDKFAPAFGARPGELDQTEVYADKAGWSVTFSQSYQGVPVFGGELKAHVDREGALTSVNGYVAPDISLDVTPTVSKAQASSRALSAVRAKPAGYEDGGPTGLTNNTGNGACDSAWARTGRDLKNFTADSDHTVNDVFHGVRGFFHRMTICVDTLHALVLTNLRLLRDVGHGDMRLDRRIV